MRENRYAAGGVRGGAAGAPSGRAITAKVAAAVVVAARDEGVGRGLTDADVPGAVAAAMWEPVYPELVPG